MRSKLILCTFSAAALFACGDGTERTDAAADGNVSIRVNALSLPEVADACYTIRVANAAGDTVSESRVCASQYGAGASIAYVAPCDADANDNVVSVDLDELLDANGQPITDFQNPCTDGQCQRTFTCLENADTPVEFNITLLRELGEGFVDISVDTSTLFCSAKVDCSYADGSPIQLLYGPNGRTDTAVMAFACTAGPGSETLLYMNDVAVTCDTGSTAFSPTGAGNIEVGAPLIAAAAYTGVDSVSLGGGVSADLVYWNVALALGPSAMNCVLSAEAVASDGGLTDGTTPEGTAYPIIRFDVPLTDTSGVLRCGQNPLNGDGGVTVEYSSEPTTFDHELDPFGRD